jgi:hypothetical protein
MGGAIIAQRHPRRGVGSAGENKKLTSGVHASARGERVGAEDGRREIKKKTYFCKYAHDAPRLSGLGPGEREWASACGRGEGPAEPAGPKAEWAGKGSRAESEEEGFLNKKLDF